MTKRLPANEPRCLAHDLAGKPNGCERSEHCARHLAIRTDRPHDNYKVSFRCCVIGEPGKFLPIEAAA